MVLPRSPSQGGRSPSPKRSRQAAPSRGNEPKTAITTTSKAPPSTPPAVAAPTRDGPLGSRPPKYAKAAAAAVEAAEAAKAVKKAATKVKNDAKEEEKRRKAKEDEKKHKERKAKEEAKKEAKRGRRNRSPSRSHSPGALSRRAADKRRTL